LPNPAISNLRPVSKTYEGTISMATDPTRPSRIRV
jgi:hypothetical protein